MKTLLFFLPLLFFFQFGSNNFKKVVPKSETQMSTPINDLIIGCGNGACTCTLNLDIGELGTQNGFSVELKKRIPGSLATLTCFSTTTIGTYSVVLDGGQGGMLAVGTLAPYFLVVTLYSPLGNSPSLTIDLSGCVNASRTFTQSDYWDGLVPGNLCD